MELKIDKTLLSYSHHSRLTTWSPLLPDIKSYSQPGTVLVPRGRGTTSVDVCGPHNWGVEGSTGI